MKVKIFRSGVDSRRGVDSRMAFRRLVVQGRWYVVRASGWCSIDHRKGFERADMLLILLERTWCNGWRISTVCGVISRDKYICCDFVM